MIIKDLDFKYVDDITEDAMRKFTGDALASMLNMNEPDKNIKSQKVRDMAEQSIYIMFKILEHKKIFKIDKKPYASYIGILISATYLYHATKTYDVNMENNYINLFKIRKYFDDLAVKCEVDYQAFDFLCQAIEGAMGEDGIPRCKPVPDSPADWMSLAIYVNENRDILFDDKD